VLSFSSIPQHGKLNALMWTATPSSGTQMCWPTKVPFFDRNSGSPSRWNVAFGNSRRPLLEYANSVPIPPSMSIHESVRVAPVARDSA
jgi:hypothetical protein